VGLEATGTEGATPLGATASALLPSISAQASHWQLADMARLADAASGVATRMRYMRLLPQELQRHVQRTPRSRRLSAFWRYAVLAVRAQLRMPSVQAARAARRARFVSRYRTYAAACSLLHSIRKVLTPVVTEHGQHSAFTNPPVATLLQWLLANSETTSANSQPGEFEGTSTNWAASNIANEQWCGHERNQTTAEASVATGAQQRAGNNAIEVWLADSAVVASGATSSVASVAALLLDAWDRPECCWCELETLEGDAWPGDSTHGVFNATSSSLCLRRLLLYHLVECHLTNLQHASLFV
jgi:hypothetical protein